MAKRVPTTTEQEQLAELPFLVMATVLARDTDLTNEEIAAAQVGLNALYMPELMEAVSAVEHTPSELFELAWLEEDLEASLVERADLVQRVFGGERGSALRAQLVELARIVAASSDRPLRGAVPNAKEGLKCVEAAFGLLPS